MVRFEDVTHRNGPDANLVADAIREWGLIHPPVNRPRKACGLSRRNIDQVRTGCFEHSGDFHTSSGVLPPGAQSWAEMRTDIGLSFGHTSRTAVNTSSDIASDFQRTTVFVGAPVGEGTDEAG
jgi:hypothetical protein